MANTEEERNAAIVIALRDEFFPLLEKLTGEIEPSVVFTPTLEESSFEE